MAKPISLPRPRLATSGEEALLGDAVVVTRLDRAIGWARKYSIFPYPFATACCAMEYMSLSMSAYDIDRFGALLPRFTPRQSDLLMVIGTVTVRQAPILRRVYDQMAEPKWVMSFGACASTGGFYDNYSTLPGIDRIIPVDVYVPGCPQGSHRDAARAGDRHGEVVVPARPRRRRLPDRREVGLPAEGFAQAALPLCQRRRERARHLQGSRARRVQSASADRGHRHLR